MIRRCKAVLRRALRDQRGMTFAEVLSALIILAMVGVTFLAGMTSISRATPRIDEKVTALSVAESQMEHIRAQAYQVTSVNPADWPVYDLLPDMPPDYSIQLPVATPVDLDGDGLNDNHVQYLRVRVLKDGQVQATVEEYRTE